MDQGRLDNFNQAIAAINSELSYRCVAWNALNETDRPPSKRSPDNWAVSQSNVSVCEGVNWDPNTPVACDFPDSSGSHYVGGICDPNGRCYYTGVSYQVSTSGEGDAAVVFRAHATPNPTRRVWPRKSRSTSCPFSQAVLQF